MITTVHFKTLDDLYSYYNKMLFDSRLPECILNMSRKTKTAGFFAAKRWRNTGETGGYVHEISLTPEGLSVPVKEWHATLVHEMCHLWQYELGNPSRSGYHNKEWAAKMEAIGLMPSSTGKPGGKKTGQDMADYPIAGGLFEEAFNALDQQDLDSFRLKYLPSMTEYVLPGTEGSEEGEEGETETGEEVKEGKSGKKTKYICSCGNKVWGKPGLLLKCLECDSDFTEEEK